MVLQVVVAVVVLVLVMSPVRRPCVV